MTTQASSAVTFENRSERRAEARARRPEPVWIASEGCRIEAGGRSYYPHQGERLRARPGLTVGAMRAAMAISELQPQLEALDEDTPELDRAELMGRMERAMARLQADVAPRIVEWTWTDELGARLPAPAADPGVLERLDVQELYYLVGALRGDAEEQQGEG